MAKTAAARTPPKVPDGKRQPQRTVRSDDRALLALAANRVAIEAVSPEIDAGRFPAKVTVGEPFVVEADIFADGHDMIAAAFLVRSADRDDWREVPMAFFDNDRWRGVTTFDVVGTHHYTLIAWRDLFANWRSEIARKHAAGLSLTLELIEGRSLVAAALAKENDRAARADRVALSALVKRFDAAADDAERLALLTDADTATLMNRAGVRTDLSLYEQYVILCRRSTTSTYCWLLSLTTEPGPGPSPRSRHVPSYLGFNPRVMAFFLFSSKRSGGQ